MVSINDVLLIIMNIIFIVIVPKKFYDIFFTYKNDKGNKEKYFILIFLMSFWQIYMVCNKDIMDIALLVNTILLCIFVVVLYEGNFYVKLGFSFLFIALCTLMEYIVWYLFMFLKIETPLFMFYGSLLSKILTYILILLLKHLSEKNPITVYRKEYSWLVLLFPSISLFITVLVLSSDIKQRINIDFQTSIVIVVILIISNILILKVYQLLIKSIEDREKNARYIQQYEMKKEHYTEMEQILYKLRKINHNNKNNLITIKSLIANDNYEEAVKYLNSLLYENTLNIFNIEEICKTGNIAVDGIVNAKYIKMIDKNIEFFLDTSIIESLPFASTDLSILLGSLLDNAIEGNEYVEGEKFIKLNILFENTYLLVSCLNPYSNTINLDKDGLPITTKNDKSSHGFGIASVIEVCEKYDGGVTFDFKDNIFKVNCILFVNLNL